MPVSLECCVTQATVYRNQMSCPWDTRVATLWVLMLSVTSSVRLEVYQSITARCQFITFQYFCKNDQGHLYTFFPLTNFKIQSTNLCIFADTQMIFTKFTLYRFHCNLKVSTVWERRWDEARKLKTWSPDVGVRKERRFLFAKDTSCTGREEVWWALWW